MDDRRMGAWRMGAVAGSVLMLLRSRYAVHAFAISLLGLAATTFYRFGIELPEALKSSGNDVMTVVIWIIAVFLLLYSIRMSREGILR
ncbi:hypothetical protein [Novosphingobium marinum]|nr:hypothetical protein [Novosphingobium marinum]